MATFVPLQVLRAVGISKAQAEPHSTLLLLAQVRTGRVASSTVIVWLHVLVFPQASVASQARVMVRGHRLLVTVLKIITATLLPLQASTAAGGSKLHAERHPSLKIVPTPLAPPWYVVPY